MKKVLCLLLALCVLCGCGGALPLGYAQTTFGLSVPVKELPENADAPDDVRKIFFNFVMLYEQFGSNAAEFSRPAKIPAEQLLLSALFLKQEDFSSWLQEDVYRIPADEMIRKLCELYAAEDFELIYLSGYYNQEYDRFTIPQKDIPEPVSAVAVLTDYSILPTGDIDLKVEVYSQILVDAANADSRYVLNKTVGYRFKPSGSTYRLYTAVAYFKSTGVELD